MKFLFKLQIKINFVQIKNFFRKIKKENLFIALLTALLSFLITFLSYYYLFKPSSNVITSPIVSDAPIDNSQINDKALKDIKTLGVLLLGYGGAGHEGGYLTDAIQVLYLDFEKKIVALISIPRDLWLKFPNNQEAKINTTLILNARTTKKTSSNKEQDFIYNGAETFKKIVSDITGLKIDYFVAVDFVGFMRTIGLELKGIDVEVSQTLDDPWYPIAGEELNTCGLTPSEVAELSEKYSGFELEKQFPCRYEHIHFEKGLVYMEGGDALKYVRSRHGSGEGDVSRGKRQQEVLIAIKNKLFSLNALDNLPSIFESLVKHIQTDINLEIIQYLIPALKLANDYQVVKINLSPSNVLSSTKSSSGQAILIPREGINKWEKVKTYIADQITSYTKTSGTVLE